MNVLQDTYVLFFIQSCVFLIGAELQLNTIHSGFGDFSHTQGGCVWNTSRLVWEEKQSVKTK